MSAIRPGVALALAGIGGWVASRLGLPLAWLIGATLVTAAISLLTGPFAVPRILYRSGQVVVGVSVGLSVNAAVFDRIGPHLFLVPLLAGCSILLGRAMVPLLVRTSGLDRPTAYFALVPAGISEMADLAQAKGADAGAVATLHVVRVFLVVCILPLVIYRLEGPALLDVARAPGAWTLPLAVALAAGLLWAVAGNLLGLPSAFMVGPMIGVAMLSASGLLAAKEPAVLLAAAQILLGFGLGARFRRDTMRRLPRALVAGTLVLALNALVMAAIALALASALRLDLPLMLLASATGGTAEMVLTAQVVAADAALVAMYQVARGLCGNLLAAPIYLATRVNPDTTHR